ncbi:MAG: hypothetical protein ACFFF9_07885 [Candidatus Thorarchaeota archaeon]
MNSGGLSSDSSFRNARLLGILMSIYAIALPFISVILPESGDPTPAGAPMISWGLILIMPFEIVLIYVIYWSFGRRSASYNIMGPAVLMYALATAPSIYSLVIGMINPPFRYLAAPAGLLFSLVGLGLSLRFVSALRDRIVAPE